MFVPAWQLPRVRGAARIGLLGGSFDPAHAGHRHISLVALQRLGLDEVWWLVSPANPLKPGHALPLAERVARARRVADHPRITVTGVEATLGTRFTADTLAALARRWPRARFVWLMGGDNLRQIHRWDRWHRIFAQVPVGVIARPGARAGALNAPAARAYSAARLPEAALRRLVDSRPPAWGFVTAPLVKLSSTAIRRKAFAEDR